MRNVAMVAVKATAIVDIAVPDIPYPADTAPT
jgi:hypothetical protein